MQMGKASTGSSCGTGGMNTKLLAAKIATKSGIDMLIANSRDIKVIHRLVGGMQIGTLFRTSGHDRKFDLPLFVERMHR
jgi:glutamate 5-kinase